MIHYKHSFLEYDILFRIVGSVVPWALARALVSGFICFAFIKWDVVTFTAGGNLMFHPFPFSLYFQIASLVLAFHTNQSYNRFWEARSHLQTMASHWADCVGYVLAFERSTGPTKNFLCPPLAHDRIVEEPTDNCEVAAGKLDTPAWRAKMLHLFSLLHSACMSYLLSRHGATVRLEVLGGVTVQEQMAMKNADDNAFLVSYWIIEELARRHAEGGLPVPAPVLSRAHHFFTLGSLAYNQACKIEDTPFPFPYIQLLHVIDFSLLCVTPLLMACWVGTYAVSITLTILGVGGFHALFLAAGLMENPFGTRPNDLPLVDLNTDFINRLISLLDEKTTEALNDLVSSNLTSAARSIRISSKEVFFSPPRRVSLKRESDQDWVMPVRRHSEKDLNPSASPPTPKATSVSGRLPQGESPGRSVVSEVDQATGRTEIVRQISMPIEIEPHELRRIGTRGTVRTATGHSGGSDP